MAWNQSKPKRKAKPTPYQSFSNKSMRVLFADRPHMALIQGWWRVSPMPKGESVIRDRWYAAHAAANFLNIVRHAK